MSGLSRKQRRAIAKLHTFPELYAYLPKLKCQGKCHASCGVAPASMKEVRTMAAAAGRSFGISDEGSCSMLVAGHCSVYQDRPLICRLWGMVKNMACPFGCKPERWINNEEARALLEQAGTIGSGYDMQLIAKMAEKMMEAVKQ